MIINTIKGVLYEVSAPGRCVVSAPVESNGVYTLAYLPEGGQAVVAATGRWMEVSNDAARVVHYLEADAFATHAANAVVHLSESERAALYRTEERGTIIGNDNASFHWFELAGAYLTSGQLKAVRFQCRSNTSSGMTLEPRFLGVFRHVEDDVHEKVGVSVNDTIQSPGATIRWEFERFGVELDGSALRFVLLEHPEDEWNTMSLFGARCMQTNDGSFLQAGSKIFATPQVTLEVSVPDVGVKVTKEQLEWIRYMMNNFEFNT